MTRLFDFRYPVIVHVPWKDAIKIFLSCLYHTYKDRYFGYHDSTQKCFCLKKWHPNFPNVHLKMTPGRKVRHFSGKKKVWIFRAVVFWKRELDVLQDIISSRKLHILQGKTAKRDHVIRFQIWKSLNLKSQLDEKSTLFFLAIFV